MFLTKDTKTLRSIKRSSKENIPNDENDEKAIVYPEDEGYIIKDEEGNNIFNVVFESENEAQGCIDYIFT